MAPISLETGATMWSPYEYELEPWPENNSIMMNELGLDDRMIPMPYNHEESYNDYDLLSHFSIPFSNFSIKRCQGFVRCDMDIDAEVIGWVIGKNGSTIKDLKNKTGCNMWVDQRALKLTITGPDSRAVEHAAKSVEAYVAAAPIKAGAVEEAVTRSLDCPPHLLDILGERTTIARIVKETRAQVVVNKKMARVIVRGGNHAVHMACSRIQATINAAASAHSQNGLLNSLKLIGHHGYSDQEHDDFKLMNPARSRAASGGVSQDDESAQLSPHLSGPSWSLFGNNSTFKTSSKSLNTSIGSKVTSPTDSYFTTFNHEDDGKTVEGNNNVSHFEAPSPMNATKIFCDPHTFASLTVAYAAGELELSALLSALKLGKYIPSFEESEIDLDTMGLMTENDFSELGLPKGPRLKILGALRALAANNASSSSQGF
mmetsp:Transcript_3135/g.4828  ORF Transcript_3135/g.4828 Transcript_3135/m.4828 type:complete len:430 (+) Transcript_3135:153-1442(+)